MAMCVVKPISAEMVDVYSEVPNVPGGVIGTHDGTFHCDEALATAMLKMTDAFKNAVVVRTRNPDILDKCNAVVDVGGKYDPEHLLFDHHQREFTDTMSTSLAQYKTRLSSAGLVYRHYGKEIIKKVVPSASEEELEKLFDKVYKSFIEHIDGGDNGVEAYSVKGEGGLVKNYSVSTTLACRVAALAPRWNQTADAKGFDEGFRKAVQITSEAFLDSVDSLGNSWLPARNIVSDALMGRQAVHSCGKIAKFDTFCPWQEHLFDVEREMGIEGQVLYVLFPDSKQGWRVRAVGVENTQFGMRKPLPWKGLRDADLSKEAGIQGCVFVHASGFIGGNQTYDGALQMAVKALNM